MEPDWGGSLELRRDPSLPAAEDEIANRGSAAESMRLFETTEQSWDGFRWIELPPEKQHMFGKSIAPCISTPKSGAARKLLQATGQFTCNGPLPDHIRAGYTLQQEDMDEINVLLARRDAHIQDLYECELEFTRIAQSPSFRLARISMWPARASAVTSDSETTMRGYGDHVAILVRASADVVGIVQHSGMAVISLMQSRKSRL